MNSKPILEGKGIEIVRRDGCEATNKIMTKCLKILFENFDLSMARKIIGINKKIIIFLKKLAEKLFGKTMEQNKKRAY